MDTEDESFDDFFQFLKSFEPDPTSIKKNASEIFRSVFLFIISLF